MLTLKQAQTIVEAALKTGREKSMKPLSVAVLDARGCLVAYAMEDGGTLLREFIAKGKAWGALGMGRSSRTLEQFAKERSHFIGAVIEASGGRLVPVPGGVLIKRGGTVVGAIGVSGDTSDNDEIAAVAGIEAAGLVAGLD